MFLPNVIKVDPYNFELAYTVSNLVHFWDSVVLATCAFCMVQFANMAAEHAVTW